MPQNKRRFQGDRRPRVLRDDARGVVRGRAIGWDYGSVCDATCRTHRTFATIHGLRDWVPVLLLRVKFDLNGIRIDIVKKDLNLKDILLTPSLDSRGTESQR